MSADTAAGAPPQPVNFNLLPWREGREAARRRWLRLRWLIGCALALLPALWLQSHYHAGSQSSRIAYTELQVSNRVLASHIEEQRRRQDTIEEWLMAATMDRALAARWSALATLLDAEYRRSAPLIEQLHMRDGQLSVHGRGTELTELRLVEAHGYVLFAGAHTLEEVRRDQGSIHFQMDVPWMPSGLWPAPVNGGEGKVEGRHRVESENAP